MKASDEPMSHYILTPAAKSVCAAPLSPCRSQPSRDPSLGSALCVVVTGQLGSSHEPPGDSVSQKLGISGDDQMSTLGAGPGVGK